MKNILILITGMPGVGKSTFAKYLSEGSCIPLVSYDHIKEKEWDLLQNTDNPEMLTDFYGNISYEFLWFFSEEIMKSDSPLIVEYFFHPMQEQRLNLLVKKYNYKTITIHFDADIKVTYERYLLRNSSAERHPGLKHNSIDFETFKKVAQPNRDFRFGEHIIFVETSNFDIVSYEEISEEIKRRCLQFD